MEIILTFNPEFNTGKKHADLKAFIRRLNDERERYYINWPDITIPLPKKTNILLHFVPKDDSELLMTFIVKKHLYMSCHPGKLFLELELIELLYQLNEKHVEMILETFWSTDPYNIPIPY